MCVSPPEYRSRALAGSKLCCLSLDFSAYEPWLKIQRNRLPPRGSTHHRSLQPTNSAEHKGRLVTTGLVSLGSEQAWYTPIILMHWATSRRPNLLCFPSLYVVETTGTRSPCFFHGCTSNRYSVIWWIFPTRSTHAHAHNGLFAHSHHA